MKYLYKTYLLLRNSVKQAVKGHRIRFDLRSQSDMNTLMSSDYGDLFSIRPTFDLEVKDSFVVESATVNEFYVDIKNYLINETAAVLIKGESLPFETSFILNNDFNYEFLVDDKEANIFTYKVVFEDVIDCESYIKPYASENAKPKFIFDLDPKFIANLGFISTAALFSTIVSFRDAEVISEVVPNTAEFVIVSAGEELLTPTTACILSYYISSFTPEFTFDLDPADLFNIEEKTADFTSYNLDLGSVLETTAKIEEKTAEHFYINDYIDIVVTSSVAFSEVETDTFNFIISFTDEINIGSQVDNNVADQFTIKDSIVDFIAHSAELIDAEINNFDAEILLDLYYSTKAISPNLYTADLLKTEISTIDEIDTNIKVIDYTAQTFGIDDYIYLPIKITAETSIIETISDPFAFDFIISEEAYFNSAVENNIAENLQTSLDSHSYVTANLLEASWSTLKFDIDPEFDIDAASSFINYVADIFEVALEIDGISDLTIPIIEYTANQFKTNLPINLNIDTEALLVCSEAVSDIFSYQIPVFLDTSVNSKLAEYLPTNLKTALDSSSEFTSSLVEAEYLGFDALVSSYIDLSASTQMTLYTSEAFITEILVDDCIELDSYITNKLSENFNLEIIQDNIDITSTAIIYLQVGATLFSTEIPVSVEVGETAYLTQSSTISLGGKINNDGTSEAYTQLAQYPDESFKYNILADTAIISDFNANFDNYLPHYFAGKTETNFDIDMYTQMSIWEYVVDNLQYPYIPINVEATMAGSFYMQEADILAGNIIVNDIILPKGKIYLYEPDWVDDLNVIISMAALYPKVSLLATTEESFIPSIINQGTVDVNSYFIYASFAKLYEYDDITDTLSSMGSSTLNELAYHKYSY